MDVQLQPFGLSLLRQYMYTITRPINATPAASAAEMRMINPAPKPFPGALYEGLEAGFPGEPRSELPQDF